MPKGRYHHGDLREALLGSAEALVRERGADGWSLRETSARIGVSAGAAYHHFASREALVHALSAQVLSRLGQRLRRAANRARGHPYQRIVHFGRSYIQWAIEDPAIARLVFRAGATSPDLAVSPHPHDVVSTELDRLVEAGGLPASARPGADFVLWSAIHGLAVLLIDGLVHVGNERAVNLHAERLIRATLTGLAQETASASTLPPISSAHTERLSHGPSPRPSTACRYPADQAEP